MTMDAPRVMINTLKWGARIAGRTRSLSMTRPRRMDATREMTREIATGSPRIWKKVNAKKPESMDISP